MDVHSPKIRSYNMSRIRSKDTKPEMLVRKFLHSKGFRFRVHDKKLPGKPDMVLPKYKAVIFVHGCFWHGHQGCKYFVLPKTRAEWWQSKISATRTKDVEIKAKLLQDNWNVITIFECELRNSMKDKSLSDVIFKITENTP